MFSAPPLTPVVKKLLITLFAAYVLELLLGNFANFNLAQLLVLQPAVLAPLTLSQLFTYVLVPGQNSGWLFIEWIFLWLNLSPFESAFGRKNTLELILAGTLGGSLAAVVFAQIPLFHSGPLAGASTIMYASIAAMSQIMPAGRRMMFFGILPLTSRQLLLVFAGFALLHFLETTNVAALAAAIGSLLAGIGYVKYMARAPKPSAPKRPGTARFRVVRGGGGGNSGGRGGSGSGRSGSGNDDGDSDRPKWLN